MAPKIDLKIRLICSLVLLIIMVPSCSFKRLSKIFFKNVNNIRFANVLNNAALRESGDQRGAVQQISKYGYFT